MPTSQPENQLDGDLSLDRRSVAAFWKARGLVRLIRAMEAQDVWVVDRDPENRSQAERYLDEVVVALNASRTASIEATMGNGGAGAMVDLSGYIRSGRALSLFSWLLSTSPESAKLVLEAAMSGESEFGRVLIERIDALEKNRLLSRVFGPDRIASVIEILDLIEE